MTKVIFAANSKSIIKSHLININNHPKINWDDCFIDYNTLTFFQVNIIDYYFLLLKANANASPKARTNMLITITKKEDEENASCPCG